MAVLNFTLANVEPFTNSETAVLFGKNGFSTTIGEIKLLCDSFTIVGSRIRFSVDKLDNAWDKNFNKHVLAVNDVSLFPNRIRGEDFLAFPINEKDADNFTENFSAFRAKTTQYTAQILNHDTTIGAGFIEIENTTSLGGSLVDKLPAPPFYVSINQLVEKNLTANNSVYIAGNTRKVVRENSVIGISSAAFNQPIGVVPQDSSFIKVFVDGLEDTTFSHSSGDRHVTIDLNSFQVPGSEFPAEKVRTEVLHYSPPLIEKGDNISVLSGNVYAVANVTYDPADGSYNAALTANTVFRVTLDSAPRANITGFTATNISENPVGVISNVTATSGSKGTLSFGYDATTYPGSFNLSNTVGYSLSSSSDFEDLFFGSSGQRIIKDVPTGLTVVRARNVNTGRRRSAYSTKAVFVRDIPIPRVQNLEVDESLFIDANRGVSIRVTIKFDKINFKDVTDYEIAYRLQGSTRTTAADDKNIITNLTNFNVVKIPNNTSSTEDGVEKISFTINNLDRGPRNNPNKILVKVTPLNGDIRGTPVNQSITLFGKRTPPLAPKNFQVGQILDNLVFAWQLARDSSGSLRDLDLEKVEIRRISERVNISDSETLQQKFSAATLLVTVPTPASSATIPCPSFEESTYMIQAIDTSGNKSVIVGVVFTPAKPADLHTFKAYSEDNPDLPFAIDYRGVSLTNDNEAEEAFHGTYPSQNTRTGGLSIDNITHTETSTAVDNANGFASGWASVSDLTDLQATANATYVTQIRDVGSLIKGKVLLNISGEPFSSRRWFAEYATVINSSTEKSNFANVLVDRNVSGVIGTPTANGIGRYLQIENPHGVLDSGESSVIYDSLINNTLTSQSGSDALDLTTTITAAGFTGSVYAVWNPGQFATDVSNANSFALIAGISNANAIVLGQAHFANGNPIKDSAGKLAHETGADHSVTNAMPNLTTVASSYNLVNLNQYNDDLESTFAGVDPTVVNQNVQIRYAASNPFYANSNVNLGTFTTNTSTVDGFVDVAGFDKEFRFFQLRLKIENFQDGIADYNLNTFRYTVDLKDKIFIRTISVGSENTTVDYTSAGFRAVPFVNGQVVNASAGSYTIIMRSITTTSCTVSIYDQTGAVVTGEQIQFEARGI